MKISVLIAIQLVFLLCYIELQESYGDRINNCMKHDDNDKCMCCKSGYRGPTCSIYCKQCSSRLILDTNCSYSCRNGHYGETCNKTCPITCANGVSGDHFCTETNKTIECNYGCIEGYRGTQCSNCINNNYFGDHCNITCSTGCLSETCNRTGHCSLGCVDGFYGGRCNYHCGSNCIERKCTQDSNSNYICTEGCVDGHMGSNCSKKCPVQCATCKQLSGSCVQCVGNYVYLPETGECKNNPTWIIVGLTISLVILGVISVIVIIIVKKKHDEQGTVPKDLFTNPAAMRLLNSEISQNNNSQELTISSNMEHTMWNINWKINWEKEEEKRLRQSILEVQKDSLGNPIKMKILLFGPTGHGKSTLGNGFRSALLDEQNVSHYHQTGIAGKTPGTFTRGVCSALYSHHLCILDMGGIYESKSFKDADVTDILTGKVPFSEKLTEHLAVIDRNNMAVPKPGTNDVSCVVIVLKPGTEFGDEMKRLLNIVNRLTGDGAISRHLVLTHLDKIDPLFVDPMNLPKIRESEKVQAALQQMSIKTGIPASATKIVRNYWKDSTTDMYSNILLLMVLDHILFDAKECHERRLTIEKMKSY